MKPKIEHITKKIESYTYCMNKEIQERQELQKKINKLSKNIHKYRSCIYLYKQKLLSEEKIILIKGIGLLSGLLVRKYPQSAFIGTTEEIKKNYMYIYSDMNNDYFKHSITREYINVPIDSSKILIST